MAKYVHTHPKDLKASDARGEGRSSGQHHGTRKIESCQVEPAQGKVTISSNYSKSGYRRKIQSINLTSFYELLVLPLLEGKNGSKPLRKREMIN